MTGEKKDRALQAGTMDIIAGVFAAVSFFVLAWSLMYPHSAAGIVWSIFYYLTLLTASGPLFLLFFVIGMAAGSPGAGVPDDGTSAINILSQFSGILLILLPVLLLGILAVIGGILCLGRRHYAWAMAGAIAAVLCVPVLGIISIIFTNSARADFR
ncbi:MAG: hypothetical protein NTY79_09535 [Chloroflexi bacterium]|nr:hypothetical protein [Chloroflexota bacterium]